MMIKILLLLIFILLFLIGGNRGIVAMLSLIGNIGVILLSIVLIYWGINPILVTLGLCIIVSCITLFYQNGRNYKTISAFISVMIVMLLLVLVVYKLGVYSDINGFDKIKQNQDDMVGLSLNIDIDMVKLGISVIIIGLIGSILDTAIAVSSAEYEVYVNNTSINKSELFISGINIGKDILGTTINTLFFAYFAEGLMLFILMYNIDSSILRILNSKIFFQGFFSILFSVIASILVIPITSYVTSYVLNNKQKFNKLISED